MTTPIVPREIAEGPDAIRQTVETAWPAARDIAGRLRRDGIRRIHLIGNGTSYHSSLAAAGLYARYATADDPVVVPVTAGAFLAYPPELGRHDAIVGISASGEFRDVVAVAEAWQGRVPVIGVVHVPGSTLTRVASEILMSAGGPSDVPVMTKTFSATLVATELLLLGLLERPRSKAVVAAILRAADHAEAAIAAAEPIVGRPRRRARRRPSTSSSSAVASPTSPRSRPRSSSRRWPSSTPRAPRPGRWPRASRRSSGPTSVVIAIAPAGPGRDAVADLVRHAAAWGARTIEVGPAADRTRLTAAATPRGRGRGPRAADRGAAHRPARLRPRPAARPRPGPARLGRALPQPGPAPHPRRPGGRLMRIVLVGAGSVEFTRNLLGDILSYPELRTAEIVLHDIDPDRLRTAERMAAWTSRPRWARRHGSRRTSTGARRSDRRRRRDQHDPGRRRDARPGSTSTSRAATACATRSTTRSTSAA